MAALSIPPSLTSIRRSRGKQWRHPDDPSAFSALLADRWAEAICNYWRVAGMRRQIDRTSPVFILDLVPAGGNPPWQMLSALLLRVSEDVESFPAFQYVACARDGTSLALLSSHPSLRRFIREGLLQLAQWNWNEHSGPELPGETGALGAMLERNPVVVLAHDMWGRLEQSLYGVHYGALLCAVPKPGDANSVEWHPIAASCPPRIQHALARYAEGINSCRISVLIRLFSTQAINLGRSMLRSPAGNSKPASEESMMPFLQMA